MRLKACEAASSVKGTGRQDYRQGKEKILKLQKRNYVEMSGTNRRVKAEELGEEQMGMSLNR